jgi:predicted TIM-barrel fold metal-dependent hydrolase
MTTRQLAAGETMRIIDSHAHVFPYLGDRAGFASVDDHLATLQWTVRQHVQPVLRKRDNSRVTRQTLLREPATGRSSLTDVGFRVGQYGRLEWEADGEELYLQYMPPLLATMTTPPEQLLALMDHAGVATAVLHNDSIYGKLNELFGDCAARWPDRFIALANVDVAPNNRDIQRQQLATAIQEQGHRGLFFKMDDFFLHDFAEDPFGDEYRPLWDYVAQLAIPVYWQVTGVPAPTLDRFEHVWLGFARWLAAYPSVATVLVGGLPWEWVTPKMLPPFVRQAIHAHPIMLEIVFPIQKGNVFRYPFPECRDAAAFLYDEFGPEKLVWGSDAPNVERYCTYRQSYEYLEGYEFLSAHDRASILGGNIARLFGLDEAPAG